MKLILTFSILISFSVFGQKRVKAINSGDKIETGIEYFENEKYDEALLEFEQVPLNDTNYALAQYEKALTLYELEKYSECIRVLDDIVNFEITNSFMYKVYLLRANAYDLDGKPERAIELFNEAIVKYPYQQNLIYNRGLTYEKLKNYPAAIADYKRAVQSNIYHANSHLRLGILTANEGLYIQSMMSLITFIWINPYDSRVNDIVFMIENISNGSFEKKPLGIEFYDYEDPYEESNLLIVNKIALSKKYKASFTIETSFSRQLHLFLSNNKYKEADYEFWNEHYMPFLQSIWDNKKLDYLSMLMLMQQTNPKTQQTIKSKSSNIGSFYDWSKTEFRAKTSKQFMEFEGKKQIVKVNYQTSHINEIGTYDSNFEFPIGNTYSFHTNGQLKTIAHFDSKGNSEGIWEIYDESKEYKFREVEFTDNKEERIYRDFYPTGELKLTYTMMSEFVKDTVKIFYRNGSPKEIYLMKNGQKEGSYEGYFPNGKLSYSYINKLGKAEGKYISYHPNGNVSRDMNFKNDLLDGKRTVYFPNKQVKIMQNYILGDADGDYIEYSQEGNVMGKGSYKKGKEVGTSEDFYSNGKLSNTLTLDESGKLNGKSTNYDLDGKKFMEFEYSKGDLSSMTFYNKEGIAEELGSKKGKKLNYILKYPNGIIKEKGFYLDGKSEGIFTYFDKYGNLIKRMRFAQGNAIDTIFTYFSNGQLKTLSVVADDELNGLFLSYNIFGDLLREGTHKDDEMDNAWYDYRNNGTLESERFYVNGSKHGIQKDFLNNGKLLNFKELDMAEIISNIYLDTNENILDEFNEYNGLVEFHSQNGKFIHLRASYLNGNADGKFSWMYPNGNIETEGVYLNDERTGIWKWSDIEGQLLKQISYVNGLKNGQEIYYFSNGKKDHEINFLNGDSQGPFIFYHENGSKWIEGNYLDGERHGRVYSYGENGAIRIIREYDQGVIINYTYLDKEGNEVAPIQLDGNEIQIVAYYKNGKKSIEHKRVNGLIEGAYKTYYENGQIHEDETFKFGENDGVSKEYNTTGKLIMQTNYVKGEVDGIELKYFDSGKIKSEINYCLDEKHGKATYYKEDGKVKMIITYYYNEALEIQNF